MANSPITTSNITAFEAAEYLTEYVGQEAAQIPNIRPFVWEENIVGKKTMVTHLRSLTPISPSIGLTATEGNALPTASWSPVATYVTCALYGFQFTESKTTNSIDPEILTSMAYQSSTAIAREFDTDLASLFPSLTAGTIGTTGGALTVALILQGEANLYSSHADVAGGFTGILHPQQYNDVLQNMLTLNYGAAKVQVDGLNKEYLLIGSTRLYRNTLVETTNSAASYAGAMFSRQALAFVLAENPSVEVMTYPGYHSWLIEAAAAFGVEVYRPTFGCYIESGVNA